MRRCSFLPLIRAGKIRYFTFMCHNLDKSSLVRSVVFDWSHLGSTLAALLQITSLNHRGAHEAAKVNLRVAMLARC